VLVCKILYVLRTYYLLSLAVQPNAGYDLLVHEVSWSHNDAPQSLGLLWMSDKLVAETSTWQHKTDKHPCPRWNSNLRSHLRLRPRGHWDRQIRCTLKITGARRSGRGPRAPGRDYVACVFIYLRSIIIDRLNKLTRSDSTEGSAIRLSVHIFSGPPFIWEPKKTISPGSDPPVGGPGQTCRTSATLISETYSCFSLTL
jgi:hypothetical protein